MNWMGALPPAGNSTHKALGNLSMHAAEPVNMSLDQDGVPEAVALLIGHARIPGMSFSRPNKTTCIRYGFLQFSLTKDHPCL